MKLKELYDKMGVPLKERMNRTWENNKYTETPSGEFFYRTSSQYAKDRIFLKNYEDKDNVIFYKKIGDKTFFAILMGNKRCAYFYLVPMLDYNNTTYFSIARISTYKAWKNKMQMTDEYLHSLPIFDEYKDAMADILFVTEEVADK